MALAGAREEPGARFVPFFPPETVAGCFPRFGLFGGTGERASSFAFGVGSLLRFAPPLLLLEVAGLVPLFRGVIIKGNFVPSKACSDGKSVLEIIV